MTSVLTRPSAGAILSYVEFNTDVTISATTEAAADTVVTAAAITVSGLDVIVVEFFAPGIVTGASSTSEIRVVLYDNGSAIVAGASMIAQVKDVAAVVLVVPATPRKRLVPAAGSHTYSIRGYRVAANGSIRGSSAGSGQPGSITVRSAA